MGFTESHQMMLTSFQGSTGGWAHNLVEESGETDLARKSRSLFKVNYCNVHLKMYLFFKVALCNIFVKNKPVIVIYSQLFIVLTISLTLILFAMVACSSCNSIYFNVIQVWTQQPHAFESASWDIMMHVWTQACTFMRIWYSLSVTH